MWLENEHVRLQLLPQLGGRIHMLQVGEPVRRDSYRCSLFGNGGGEMAAARWTVHRRLYHSPALLTCISPLFAASTPPQDKHSGYDAIYRQHVIKPALVGLAGPWISGGVEFNWCGRANGLR